jgi:serine O-acetyltransferase
MISEDLRANKGIGIISLAMIITLRTGKYCRDARGGRRALLFPGRLATGILHRFLSLLLSCSVPFRVRIGRSVRWEHGFSGIFISRDAIIGDGCTILHQVTIGSNIGSRAKKRAAPVIGDGVFIAAGAKIIGGVTIGNGSRIGANAVAVIDVPAGATCTAPPALLSRPDHKRESANS